MLNLKLSQNRQHIKCNQKTVLFVSLEISPDETTQFIQRNHHVSLVIDCSGSMDGKKIQDAKEAAINVVRQLSPNDLVSIVTFETDVSVKLNPTPASDRNIENIINSIDVGGATALHGGILAGFQLLKQASAPNMINRLEVFTDGEPNVVPYDDIDFTQLVQQVRNNAMTLDVFGIGDDYNGPLLMKIAEIGGGKWAHVSDTEALTTIVGAQVTEMQNTVISNPQLQLTLMSGAELASAAITKPTLQEIQPESRQTIGNTTSIGLKDIIKNESQTIAMRISVPSMEGNDISFLTAVITEGNNEIANQTGIISCTDDKELYNLEVDPSPRVLLSSTEATVLLRKGLEGDQDATELAKTILSNLDDPETTQLMDDDAHATVLNAKKICGDIQPGMSESDKKRVLHDTTVISETSKESDVTLTCPNCDSPVRPTSKICGQCGKPIKKTEGEL